jgi:MYXO-CTERM domain-containing protein
MTRHLHALAALAALAVFTPTDAQARSNFPARIPNGSVNSCSNCHVNPNGGGTRTAFGDAFRSNGRVWNAALAGGDPDMDGWSNGQELGDPFGRWVQGNQDPPAPAVTRPGDGTSFPNQNACSNFTNFSYNDCDAQATCSDTDPADGAFTCTCAPGLLGSGHTFIDTATSPFSVPYDLNASSVSGCVSPCDDQNVCRQDLGNTCTPDQSGGVTCTCTDGFFDDGTTCADVDECTDPTTCNEDQGFGTCSNDVGDYDCACDIGFQPAGSGLTLTCVDTNECDLGACGANVDQCSNTDGGYDCTCDAGYEPTGMAVDLSLTCTDVDECAAADACGKDLDPSNLCANTAGGYDCSCAAGYADDGTTCVDVDECLGDPCGANATGCTNTTGAYTCACAAGFDFDGTTCVVENPCTVGTDTCSDDAICSPAANAAGFECACKPGFTGDGTTCDDVDECAQDNACGSELGDNTCTNNAGGYTCACTDGFTFEGAGPTLTCVDIDECQDDPCGENSTACNNADGGFFCECADGYAAARDAACADVDECADPTTCGADTGAGTCSNTPGSYDCTCAAGYTDDGSTCVDTDECADGADDCADGETCVNQPGGFTCEPGDAPDAGGDADAGVVDSDAGSIDTDGGPAPGEEDTPEDCACRAVGAPSPSPAGLLVALLALVGWRRRD